MEDSTICKPKKDDEGNNIVSPIVIVGASHAGIGFASQMRKYGFNGSLILVDRQKGGPMERPPLSKTFLLEETDKVNPIFLLKRAKWYKDQEIMLKNGVDVSKLDIAKKIVSLSNGECLNYEKLILATGAVPRLLPDTDGLSNVFVLETAKHYIKPMVFQSSHILNCKNI